MKWMGQMVLRVQRRRAPVGRRRVHGLLLGGHDRVSGGVGRLDGQSGHRWPGGQRIHGSSATSTAAGGGRLVRVELQAERGGQRRRGHVATVVLRTADGRRADPATPGIRRLVHRPGGVLTHWRRDGCGQPVPGMINARPRSAGQRVVARPTILCSGYSATTTILCNVSYAARTYVYMFNNIIVNLRVSIYSCSRTTHLQDSGFFFFINFTIRTTTTPFYTDDTT